VAMPVLAQAVIVASAVLVILHARPCPVIDGVSQTGVTPVAHADADRLAALPGDRGHPALSPQGLIVSFCQGPCGLGEHRGGDHSAHARQGSEDSHVTVLSRDFLLAELLQQRFNLPGDFEALVMEKPKAGSSRAM
jgi:hypothetical protein